MGLRFGSFELRPGRGLFDLEGRDLPISPKPLALLTHLVQHRDRVVPRSELLDEIWPGVQVSDAAFDSVLRDLRRALGETAAQPRLIATLRGRGLCFVGSVQEVPSARPGESAWQEAADHFERALRALDLVLSSQARTSESTHPGCERRRADLLVALARARWSAGSTDASRSAFLDAAEVGRRARDGSILAEAALGYAGRTDVTPGVNREAVALLREALEPVPKDAFALRSELLSRLGTELYYDGDASLSLDLTRQGIETAERAHDPGVLAYALTARHFVLQRPDVPIVDRLALGDRALELVGNRPASDVLALALQQRLVDLLELAGGAELEATLDRYERVVDELDQPFFRWLARMFRGMHDLLRGDVARAESTAHATFEIGRSIGTPNATLVLAGQLFGIRREQGRLAELESIMEAAASGEGASLPIFQAGRVAVLAEGTAPDRTCTAIDAVFARDLDDFPRDQNWLAVLGTLAPAVAAHGSGPQIGRLIDLLEPHAGRVIVVGQGATIHGSTDHHLGGLCAALGRSEEAVAHFRRAGELHMALGAPLWIERTRREREMR